MIGTLRARFGRRSLMYGVALAAIASGALVATGASAADKPASRSAAASAKKAGSFDFGNWSSYLGSGSSSQYSALTQINKSNVDKLQVAWTWDAGEGPAPRFGPLVVNGKMYLLHADAQRAGWRAQRVRAARVVARGQATDRDVLARGELIILDEIARHLERDRDGVVGEPIDRRHPQRVQLRTSRHRGQCGFTWSNGSRQSTQRYIA